MSGEPRDGRPDPLINNLCTFPVRSLAQITCSTRLQHVVISRAVRPIATINMAMARKFINMAGETRAFNIKILRDHSAFYHVLRVRDKFMGMRIDPFLFSLGGLLFRFFNLSKLREFMNYNICLLIPISTGDKICIVCIYV